MGIPTGGTAPRGFRTERGDEPSLAEFGLVAHDSADYPPRTWRNVVDSDATLMITAAGGRGTRLTRDYCTRAGSPLLEINLDTIFRGRDRAVASASSWLRDQAVAAGKPIVLNVAGSRESKWPGIEREATGFLLDVFKLMEMK